MSKDVVGIEEITSGSYSKRIFTFYGPQGKIIDVEPFVLRMPTDYYGYPHYIDQENFHMWVERTKGRISEYDKRQGFLTEWGDDTKAALFELISDGAFNTGITEFVVV